MNINKLADALDHWKGSILELMKPILRDVHVLPMFTRTGEDEPPWGEKHLSLYASLLGLDVNRILQPDRYLDHLDRETYFGDPSLGGDFDLFLDPDNGIEPRTRGCCEQHVTLKDLSVLMPEGGDRLVLLYQHSQPYNMRDSIINRLPAIEKEGWRLCALWSGVVSMLFLSREQQRIDEVRGRIRKWLGPCFGGVDGAPDRLLPSSSAAIESQ
jgi:hypothetical protein